MPESKRVRKGLIEFVDENGEITRQKPPKYKANKKPKDPNIHRVNVDGKLVWMQKGVSPDHLPKADIPYSDRMAEYICYLISEGSTILEVSKLEGMPSASVIYQWTHKNDDFREMLKKARQDRAHFYHDKAIAEAFEPQWKDDVPAAQLRVKTLQWAAQIGSPQDYAVKNVHDGNSDKPIRIIIETGVPKQIIEVKSERETDVGAHGRLIESADEGGTDRGAEHDNNLAGSSGYVESEQD